MTTGASNIVWQSYDGEWNRGFWRPISNPDYDDYSDTDFSYLATGCATEDKALDALGGLNPGHVMIEHFSPHEREHNDHLDLCAQAFGNPTQGPRIYQDPDVAEKAELEKAQDVVARAQLKIERMRRDALLFGLAQSQESRNALKERRQAQDKIEFLRPRVTEAAKRMPTGPFYTAEALHGFRDEYANMAEAEPNPYWRSRHEQTVAFYDEQIAKAEKLQSTASGVVAGTAGPQSRQPKGVPVGGQFATKERAENPDLT